MLPGTLTPLLLPLTVLTTFVSVPCSGCNIQDTAAEVKSEIAFKYSQYDRAISQNDAAKLLEFYSRETTDNYAEEIKGRSKRSRKEIQDALGARMRRSNKILDAIAIKGHRTDIKLFRLGEGIAVVRTEEKTAIVRLQTPTGSNTASRKLNDVTVTAKMEIWIHILDGWKLENTRVTNRASVATYVKPTRGKSKSLGGMNRIKSRSKSR